MKRLEDISFSGKTVFLRVDFNVPLSDQGGIRDDTRIRASLPTIKYLLSQKARLVVASHLGRPKGKVDAKLSLRPVAKRLGELIGREVILAPAVVGDEVEKLKKGLGGGQVLLLENVRFEAQETANDTAFAQKLAQGVDVYINDAFGACHRAHASVVAITQFVKEKAAGYLLQKEVEYLSRAVHASEKPYVAILGGAKVADKIPVIQNLLGKADHILIGGAMAYTFFKAQGYDVGKSLVEEDKKDLALEILKKAQAGKVDLVLPSDHLLATAVDKNAATEIVASFPFPADRIAVDIGPRTADHYAVIISQARMVVWNGPLGVFEIDKFAQGTMRIAAAVAAAKATTIVGGGDSIAALEKAGVSSKITHISTGGGASLEYLAFGTLPGIEALK
ncbi:MAG: phosphoglycerate kinase [Candidatus Aminicenantes bacterium RBG_19FT_COMBO_58_17]|nr:MAG: phosphoglycerate kinase [Candidatus Aminicenantes bacterium RBG_19FT_COMBO_58_17]